MSYIVFARKWRPTNFDDVVGQKHITDTLKKAIEKERIAHAYIFSGTRGVGKTTTARILARALNCEKGPTPVPCGTCDSCRGIVSGASFDVLEIDGASNNSVDDIRELRENVGYSSMGGKYRIYVIDEVHMLSKAAFNALLKTLEEPPPKVIFIFATTEPQKIPATIHSRCQRYDFRRIMPEQILERLSFICGKENIKAETTALALVASKADGSMRDALSLLDQACSYCQGTITEKETRIVLGLVNTEIYARIMDAVASKSPSPALEAVQQILFEGYDLHEFVSGLEDYVRTLLFTRLNGGTKSPGTMAIPEAAAQDITRSSACFSEGDLFRMIEIIRRAENDIKWSAFPRFAAEMMLLKLVFLDSTVTFERILKMFDSIREDKKPIPLPADTKAAYSPEAGSSGTGDKKKTDPAITDGCSEPAKDLQNEKKACTDDIAGNDKSGEKDFSEHQLSSVTGSDIAVIWREFLDKIMQDRPHIGTFLALATVAGHTDSSIDLVFEHNFAFQFSEVNKKQHREEITKMFHDFVGKPFKVLISLEAKPPQGPEPKHNKFEAHTAAIESEIAREPVIQSVLEIFDGEVLN
jgi:DNA polymerase III subunit gamma/tau